VNKIKIPKIKIEGNSNGVIGFILVKLQKHLIIVKTTYLKDLASLI
jgi:hypothetical protein